MTKFMVCLLVLAFLLTACTTASPVSSPTPITITDTSYPTATPYPTATQIEWPSDKVNVSTTLYAGPSNNDFEEILAIAPGQTVTLMGTFGDFVQVSYQGQIGFVPKNALGQLPATLQPLSDDSVPQVENNLINYFYHPSTTITDGKASIDCLTSDDFCAGYDEGTFAITSPISFRIDLRHSNGFGAIVISGRLPGGGMDWWENRLSVYIGSDGSVQFRDGQNADSIYTTTITGIQNEPFSVLFHDTNGKKIEFISQDGKELASIDLPTLPLMNFPDGLFPDHHFYVGALVGPHNYLAINNLILSYAPDGIYHERSVGMRELADQLQFLIGADLSSLYEGNLNTYSILENDFNGATIDFGWDQIEPEKGKFDFTMTDPLVQFALEHNMKITGLHLLWGERGHLPGWLVNGNFSKDELKEMLREYIFSLANHYKGKIFIWSIANEYTDRVLWGGDFWRDKLGPEYVKLAFTWAREADPNAILLLNEDGNESMVDWHAQVTTTMLSYVKNWKLEGVPIDAIGMQMHFGQVVNNPIPTTNQVVETMNKFSEMGLPIYITEFDLNLQNVPGSEAERFSYQADGYLRMFRACLEADACRGFSVFGVSDASSWLNSNYSNAQPLLFDKDNKPKPAYYALLNELQNRNSNLHP